MPADIICRYGGEEFVVILPHVGIGTMTPLANALLQQIGADHSISSIHRSGLAGAVVSHDGNR